MDHSIKESRIEKKVVRREGAKVGGEMLVKYEMVEKVCSADRTLRLLETALLASLHLSLL